MKKDNEEELFDDCPICQAMKKAKERGKDLSFDELQEAFHEAEKQGATVGTSKDLEK